MAKRQGVDLKKMKHVFNPLDTEEFKCRTGNSFPAVYLTVISIIQGVALGILASNTFDYIKNPDFAEHWIRFLPYSAMSFISIIVVSFEYTWFVGVFKRSPKIWDTVVPFVLGLSEIGPMFYLTNPSSWWLLTSVFCCVGAGSFFNTLWNCKQSMFGKKAYHMTRSNLKWNILLALIAALNCTFAWIWILSSMEVWYLEILFFILLIICTVGMMCKDEKFMKDLHKDFGLSR